MCSHGPWNVLNPSPPLLLPVSPVSFRSVPRPLVLEFLSFFIFASAAFKSSFRLSFTPRFAHSLPKLHTRRGDVSVARSFFLVGQTTALPGTARKAHAHHLPQSTQASSSRASSFAPLKDPCPMLDPPREHITLRYSSPRSRLPTQGMPAHLHSSWHLISLRALPQPT